MTDLKVWLCAFRFRIHYHLFGLFECVGRRMQKHVLWNDYHILFCIFTFNHQFWWLRIYRALRNPRYLAFDLKYIRYIRSMYHDGFQRDYPLPKMRMPHYIIKCVELFINIDFAPKPQRFTYYYATHDARCDLNARLLSSCFAHRGRQIAFINRAQIWPQRPKLVWNTIQQMKKK